MENLANRILQTNTKKKETLVQCFKRLAPLEQANVANQKSITTLQHKLKVPKQLRKKIAEEIIATKGVGSMITLEQFLSWAEANQ